MIDYFPENDIKGINIIHKISTIIINLIMCYVHVVTNDELSTEEKDQKRLSIKKKFNSPVINFFSRQHKKFEKQLENYKAKHPRSEEWKN